MEHELRKDQFLEFFVSGVQKLGFSLQESTLEKFHLYYKELRLWNKSVNLTGLQTDKEQAILLFADSLAAFLVFSEHSSHSVIDIGTGGGFPGIPLKLAFPSLQVTLMEPRANKMAFLHTIIGKLELKGVSVIQTRLEACGSILNQEEKWDMAISKAVSFEKILPYVKNVLKNDGKLIVFRAKKIQNREKIEGMAIEEEILYELPYGYGTRVLSVLKLVP